MSYYIAAEYIKSRLTNIPKTAVVLGTGLGDIAKSIENPIVIPYGDIPGFPNVEHSWHKCRMIVGCIHGYDVIFMQGRIHYYEGYSLQDVVFPIRMLKLIGVENIILTNASGAVNENYIPGDVVVINDHIKFGMDSPARGINDENLGDRFFDMCNAYDKNLIRIACQAADNVGITLHEGTYAYMTGPQFETPSEIKMLKILGADLVGMSTVPEVIEAVHCGVKILGLSGVTNMAAGMDGGGLNNEIIADAENILKTKFNKLISEIIRIIT